MADIKVRVGQQNTVKVISSVSGAAGGKAIIAENVIGGIASVTSLHVSGISTFVGIATFNNDVYINGDLYVTDDIIFDEVFARNINISGIGTIPTLNSTNATISNNLNVSGVSTLGVTSISQLNVSGVSTFAGVGTFFGDLYVGGDLYVTDEDSSVTVHTFTAVNADITGVLIANDSFYYSPAQPFGIAYFDNNDLLVSTGTTESAISDTNYIISTDSSGIPTWSKVIDGGSY